MDEGQETDNNTSLDYPSYRLIDTYCFTCLDTENMTIDELKHRNKRVYAYGKCLQCQTPAARLISRQKYDEILYMNGK